MGHDPRSMPKDMRDKAGITLVGGHARLRLAPALAGYFFLNLGIDPPTTTHHDKTIQKRGGQGGHMTLVDSPALRAVWEKYLRLVPERRTLAPLIPPVALHVHFRFRLPEHWGQRAASSPAGPGWFHIGKPDLDNQVKVLKDVLALRGYLANDSHVAMEFLSKRWALEGGPPGIFVYARTLASPADRGQMIGPDPSDGAGRIYPNPLSVRQEVESLSGPSGADRALEIGTPGGKRVPERRKRPRRRPGNLQDASGGRGTATEAPQIALGARKRK